MNRQNPTYNNNHYDLADIERRLYSDSSNVPMVKIKDFFNTNAGLTAKLAQFATQLLANSNK